MTCWKKKEKRVEKKYWKPNVVHPESVKEVNEEFMVKFEKEVMYCGGCKEPFNLGSNELKIHCNLCDRFFHCKIAGPCLGKDCLTITGSGQEHRARYCYDCVKYIYKDKKGCRCKDCFKG